MGNIDEFLNRFSKYGKNRKDSDENYVIDLCDELLGETASRQHCFDFLKLRRKHILENIRKAKSSLPRPPTMIPGTMLFLNSPARESTPKARM